ncbi:SigB/SigF/SigG family RNA polymerase sigma factor [Labedaea rhizosphaerae]|nr:SigB/SigF/SigG family RNA polymerase sigma factor [Labedaea rhizosphaerae]
MTRSSAMGQTGQGEYDHLAPLFEKLAALPEGSREHALLRERLVTEHLPVAEHIARRFSRHGAPEDDVVQVARIGLIKAVDRFDPSLGHDFMSFAVPTVMGEVRRHFRDTGWSVRVPRRLKELALTVNAASTELAQVLGRAPTPSELASHLGVPKEEVFEALEATGAHHASSLDRELTDRPDAPSLADTLGEEDPELADAEARETVYPLLRSLPERERRIVVLRFFGNLTQSQIAQRVGLSQMHVSRLLSQSLDRLRKKADS